MMDTQALFPQLHSGEIYDPGDPAMLQAQQQCQLLLYQYNATRPDQPALRRQLLERMLAQAGENCWIEPPFHANWGGRHLHLGSQVYINSGLTAVDDTHIWIGDHTMLGPNVTLAAAAHPLSPAMREKGLQYNRPLCIGRNCWIGAGAILLPGVSVGDNTVIGAGSVVTRDIPANVVAAGVPCRVLHAIDSQ